MKNYTIWSNTNVMYDGVEKDYQELNDLTDEEMNDVSSEEIYMWADENNWYFLDDERANLNIQLDEEIIVIADLGLWYGNRIAYKIIKSGNIADCLSFEYEYADFYCDQYDMRAKEIHHDGTNYYLYRVFKSGLTEQQKENFLNNTKDKKAILRYTRSIRPYISAVYGWGGRQLSPRVAQKKELCVAVQNVYKTA